MPWPQCHRGQRPLPLPLLLPPAVSTLVPIPGLQGSSQQETAACQGGWNPCSVFPTSGHLFTPSDRELSPSPDSSPSPFRLHCLFRPSPNSSQESRQPARQQHSTQRPAGSELRKIWWLPGLPSTSMPCQELPSNDALLARGVQSQAREERNLAGRTAEAWRPCPCPRPVPEAPGHHLSKAQLASGSTHLRIAPLLPEALPHPLRAAPQHAQGPCPACRLTCPLAPLTSEPVNGSTSTSVLSSPLGQPGCSFRTMNHQGEQLSAITHLQEPVRVQRAGVYTRCGLSPITFVPTLLCF